MGRTPIRASLLGGALLATLLGACRPSPPASAPEDGIWFPERASAPGRSWPDLSQKEFVEVRLPQAPATEPDRHPDRSVPRFVVNVSADGKVQFKGNTYDLADAAAEEASLADFRQLLGALLENAAWREPDGSSRVVVLLFADRRARWTWISRLLGAVVPLPAGIRQIEIATRGASQDDPQVLRLGVAPGRAAGESPPLLALRLATEPGPGPVEAESPRVQVAVGRNVAGFPAAFFDDPSFLALVDGTWRKVRDWIRSGAWDPRATLEVATPDVPWAYVVTVLGLLRQAGGTEIEVPSLAMTFRAPGDAPAPRHPPMAHDGPGVGLVLACVVLALLVGVVVLAPGRRGSRSPRG